ncbi:MAG: hypothetical protein SF029_19005 [bacterium]|nr:hypothetical protein [bacterium]
MHNTTKKAWLNASAALLLLALAFAAVLSVNVSGTVEAQGVPAPTATPTDPSWRGFMAAREAVEEERNIDLTIIRSYDFDQTEWRDGIHTCKADAPEEDVYFGWSYLITNVRGEAFQIRVAFDLSVVIVCDQVVTTTAAPVAEGTADPSLPAPVTASGASGGFELGGHVVGLSGETVAAMRSARMTWVKKQLRYNLGDGTGGAQALIASARANNFKILLGIVGNPSQMTDYNAYIATYANFVGEVAALGADAIEVWNEPNIDREWPNGRVNGATYTQLLAAAYNAIKSRNPNTIVISGAPAPTGFFGAAGCAAAGCNDDTFMQQMAAAGAARYMDCVGLHYNEGIVSPTASSGDPRGNYPTYYFGTMTARGYNPFGGKPVCYTEFGYLTPEGWGPLSALFAWGADTSIQEQATWLGEAVRLARSGGRVRLMIIWNVDFQVYNDDPQAGFAIIRRDRTCPACSQLAAAMGG